MNIIVFIKQIPDSDEVKLDENGNLIRSGAGTMINPVDKNALEAGLSLRDRFGEHGLIAVVILEKRENELFVNEWLMSCRVLKRGMEEFIADKILSLAAEQGFRKVIGEYLATPKNAMVKDLYKRMGFTRVGENRFEAEPMPFTAASISAPPVPPRATI